MKRRFDVKKYEAIRTKLFYANQNNDLDEARNCEGGILDLIEKEIARSVREFAEKVRPVVSRIRFGDFGNGENYGFVQVNEKIDEELKRLDGKEE